MIRWLVKYRKPIFAATALIFLIGIFVGLGGYMLTNNDASTFVAEVAGEKIPRNRFDVQVRNLEAGEASRLGLNVSSGALVVGVVSGMPADKAGMRTPAVITAAAGHMAKLSVRRMPVSASTFSSFQSAAFSVWSGWAG